MKLNELKYLCKSLANSTSSTVRLYQNKQNIYHYSVYPITPDPFLLYEKDFSLLDKKAGIITTDLFQYYGYVLIDPDYHIVIGPTSILTIDKKKLDNLIFLLNVKAEEQEEYIGKLNASPTFSAERMGWFLSFIATSLNAVPLFIEEVAVQTNWDKQSDDIATDSVNNELLIAEEEKAQDVIYETYQHEKMMVFYIKNGQPETLETVLSAFPKMKAGLMAEDTLRQYKDMGICCATIASRASIEGGLNIHTAFYLSDLYIQKIEMLHDSSSIQQLINQLIIDFAKRTKQAKYNCNNSKLFLKCAHYVSENLFNNIKIQDMANEFQISRSYLCHQFHKKAEVTLTQYILYEKVIESQRLLQFTNKSISDIALHLAFSSQSHFQTVFKKFTGITPNKYRETFARF